MAHSHQINTSDIKLRMVEPIFKERDELEIETNIKTTISLRELLDFGCVRCRCDVRKRAEGLLRSGTDQPFILSDSVVIMCVVS